MELGPLIGVFVALVAILGGQWLEGGRVSSILQPTAALIVLGGTAGAVLLQFSLGELKAALQAARLAFAQPPRVDDLVEPLVRLARKARREGVLALERELDSLGEPFLRRALEMSIDGISAERLRETMELEIDARAEEVGRASRVFEAAGGYAPTIGILGAVLGLVHVMEHLSDPSKLGGGIAVAFVATLYGVGLANLVLLPLAGKLRARANLTVRRLELALEGAVGITHGDSPRIVERRLAAFLAQPQPASPRLTVSRPTRAQGAA